MDFILTQQGTNIANASSTGGPQVNLVEFRVSEYDGPELTEQEIIDLLDMPGSTNHVGNVSGYTVRGPNDIFWLLRMNQGVGNFDFNCIGIYHTSNGFDRTLFAFHKLEGKVKKTTAPTANIVSIEATSPGLQGTLAQVTFDLFDSPIAKPVEVQDIHLISDPISAPTNFYVAGLDNKGSKIKVYRHLNDWKIDNYIPFIQNGTVTVGANSPLQLFSTDIDNNIVDLEPGKYIVYFTSGALQGLMRKVSATAQNTISWLESFSSSVQEGDTFIIYRSFYSDLGEVDPIPDSVARRDVVGRLKATNPTSPNDVVTLDFFNQNSSSGLAEVPISIPFQKQTITAPFVGKVSDIYFVNQVYVAVGDTGQISRSRNLIDWESVASSTVENLCSILNSNAKWLASGDNGEIVCTETIDASANWHTLVSPFTGKTKLKEIGSLLFGFSDTGEVFYTSDILSGTWTAANTLLGNSSIVDIEFHNGFYFVATSDSKVSFSADLATWSLVTAPPSNAGFVKFVINSGTLNIVDSLSRIFSFVTPQTWNTFSSIDQNVIDVQVSNDIFYAITTSQVFQSNDLKKWEIMNHNSINQTTSQNNSFVSLSIVNNFVVVGANDQCILMHIPDSQNMGDGVLEIQSQTSGGFQESFFLLGNNETQGRFISDIKNLGGYFVYVQGQNIFYTNDPASNTWSYAEIDYSLSNGLKPSFWNRVEYSGTQWMVVGENGFIAFVDVDPTGVWTARQLNAGSSFTAVAGNSNKWIVAGRVDNNIFQTTNAAANWSSTSFNLVSSAIYVDALVIDSTWVLASTDKIVLHFEDANFPVDINTFNIETLSPYNNDFLTDMRRGDNNKKLLFFSTVVGENFYYTTSAGNLNFQNLQQESVPNASPSNNVNDMHWTGNHLILLQPSDLLWSSSINGFFTSSSNNIRASKIIGNATDWVAGSTDITASASFLVDPNTITWNIFAEPIFLKDFGFTNNEFLIRVNDGSIAPSRFSLKTLGNSLDSFKNIDTNLPETPFSILHDGTQYVASIFVSGAQRFYSSNDLTLWNAHAPQGGGEGSALFSVFDGTNYLSILSTDQIRFNTSLDGPFTDFSLAGVTNPFEPKIFIDGNKFIIPLGNAGYAHTETPTVQGSWVVVPVNDFVVETFVKFGNSFVFGGSRVSTESAHIYHTTDLDTPGTLVEVFNFTPFFVFSMVTTIDTLYLSSSRTSIVNVNFTHKTLDMITFTQVQAGTGSKGTSLMISNLDFMTLNTRFRDLKGANPEILGGSITLQPFQYEDFFLNDELGYSWYRDFGLSLEQGGIVNEIKTFDENPVFNYQVAFKKVTDLQINSIDNSDLGIPVYVAIKNDTNFTPRRGVSTNTIGTYNWKAVGTKKL